MAIHLETSDLMLNVVYLGYLLNQRGSWQAHVERRVEKAVKWDNVAVSMLGKTGGAPVDDVATVRETTAETGILYGAKFIGGTGAIILDVATAKQATVAKEILGLRSSTDNVGALLELGCNDI